MALSEARGVGPALFDRDWSRISGSWQGLARKAQMVRAARGYVPAIFKPIPKGGCHTGAQLKAQLTYLTTKSSHILDSRGTHDGKKTLTGAEIDRVVRRFENQWGERHSPKLGHTSHLLMAFPVGTGSEKVRAITEAVCERFFQGEGSHFDYIAAIHHDRAHPHAHIVLNRRSKDGEMFFLGKDHHFNYDAFRVAMVEAAKVHGIRLEATRRLDRGVTTYRAETPEIYKARDEGRPPVERQRTGADLAAALKTVAHNALTYRGLAVEASRSTFDDVAEALERASTILASGGQVQSDGAIYMSQDETAFDTLITEFSRNIRQIEAAIDRAPAALRPEIERKLTDVLASVAHLNPLGDRSAALLDAPSRDGVYARANMREDQMGRLDDDAVKARLGEALQGTGIDPEAVASRMREGAGTAALERQWLTQDLRAIARAGGLDLEQGEDREDALDRLETVHVRLGDTLTEARILRDVDEVEDGPVALTERVVGASRAHISERSFDIEDKARQDDAEQRVLAETAPDVLAFLRRAEAEEETPLSETSRQLLVAQIDRTLTPNTVTALRAGHANVLEKFTEHPLRQLELAKAYLESSEVTAHGPAMERVLDALAEEQIEAQRARHATAHGEKGTTHG
jgi:type IV secretion system T-DNA border endonuclease VirD2